ncbi:phage tail sheath protein [Nitrobacter hamburgensis X14]|uniref:Phage tail sheath protein n=1 Tax=Nitrobacter hamburgensis (strain DSM 10229 / NCIMB 13809 / X14) TaxID=323097 RepID=Q1QPY9_NITHX|nr:phage tail sheath C-terminal domain-containing protein [Nitrobacter hamburgensis]ABE61708.1 phage tail sheath protein [Nitrobacter hamburgensis X14]
MPAALSYPGVYVNEIPSGVRTITGVATSVAAFIGSARKGPVDTAVDIVGFGDFERIFGGLWTGSNMGFAVRDFFFNGGARAVIVRLFDDGAGGNADAAIAAVASITAAARGGANGQTAKTAAKAVYDLITADPNAKQPVKDAAKAAMDAINVLPDNADAAAIEVAAKTADSAAPKTTLRMLHVGTLTFKAAAPGGWANRLRILVSAAKPATAAGVAATLGVATADLFDLTVTDLDSNQTEFFENLTVKNSLRRVDHVLNEGSTLIGWGGDNLDTQAAALPDFTAVFGDDQLGQKYAQMLVAQKQSPDPTQDPLKAAKKAYADALAATANLVGDGGMLGSTDFLKPDGEDGKTGLYALEQLYTRDGIFNMLCIPPYTAGNDVDLGVVAAAGAYCEKRRAILIVDPPSGWNNIARAVSSFSADPDQVGYRGSNGVIFFPRLKMPNPLKNNRIEDFAPCGVVAGLFARTDTQRGVWKSPAGIDTSLLGVSSLTVPMTDSENGLLNPLGINCLRHFPIFGSINWGARTLRGADAFADEYKYVAVRRTALYIEESLYRALKWVVFEPNDEPLWAQIRLNVGAFMHNLFRQRAFAGESANDAYFVKCDGETTTQNDINLGIVNIKVGFKPLKPAEFVVLQIQQMAGSVEA